MLSYVSCVNIKSPFLSWQCFCIFFGKFSIYYTGDSIYYTPIYYYITTLFLFEEYKPTYKLEV